MQMAPLDGNWGSSARESSVLEKHTHSPTQNHPKGQHKEEGGGLLNGDQVAEVVATEDANQSQACQY